jgi:hypothetical protein
MMLVQPAAAITNSTAAAAAASEPTPTLVVQLAVLCGRTHTYGPAACSSRSEVTRRYAAVDDTVVYRLPLVSHSWLISARQVAA